MSLSPQVNLPPAARANAELIPTIVDVLRMGAYRRTAAKYARISPATLDRWITRGEQLVARYEATGEEPTDEERWYMELALQVNMVEGDIEMRAIGQVRQAGNDRDWRASAWLLQHRFKDLWSPKSEVEQTTGQSGEADQDVDAALELLAQRLEAIESGGTNRDVVDAEVVSEDDIPVDASSEHSGEA